MKKVLIVGALAVVGKEGEVISNLILPPNAKAIYWGGLLGLDCFKDYDVAIIIGRNEPRLIDIEALVRALYARDPENINFSKTGQYKYVERGITSAVGYKAGVLVAVHEDPKCQIILEMLREKQTMQGIDRLRNVWSDEDKEIYVMSNLTLPIPVNCFLNEETLALGYNILTKAWKLNGGVYLPISAKFISEKLGFCTFDQARKYLSSINKDKPSLLNSLIRISQEGINFYSFRLVGNGSPSTYVLSLLDKDETKQQLINDYCWNNIEVLDVV